MLLCSVVGGMMFVGTGDARDPLQWVAGLLEGMTTAGGSTGGTTGGPEGTAASESSGATGAAAITGDAESSASAHGTTGGAETTTVAGGDAKGQDGGVESASTGGDTGEATEATGSGDGGESTTGPAPEADTAGSTTEVTPPTPKPKPKPRGPIDMALVIESDGRYTPKELGPKTHYRGARRHCANLRAKGYANLTKWRVPTTGSVLRFFEKIDPVVVWTSTRGDGGREVVHMLNGLIEVVDDASKARAVCVSRK